MEQTTETVRYEGINAQGFGTIARRVMRDKELSLGAKGVYAYFCSLAGGGESSFPNRETILKELGISAKTYYKHRDLLIEKGYLRVEMDYINTTGTPVRHNMYIIVSEVATNSEEQPDTQYATSGPTNPVDLKSVLGFDKKSDYYSYPQSAGQNVSSKNYHLRDVENSDFPQSPGQDVSGKNAYIRKFTTPIKEKNITYNSILVDSLSNQPSKVNLQEEYDQLCSTAVNRNRLLDGRMEYEKLREKFSAVDIFAAWTTEQARCEGREAKYYTQLYRWLTTHAEKDCKKVAERKKPGNDSVRARAFRDLYHTDEAFRKLVEEDEAFKERMAIDDKFTEEEIREGQTRLRRIISIIDAHMLEYGENKQVS